MSTEVRARINEALKEAKGIIFGQDNLLDAIMASLICEGHLLIEGMPGLGKTLSVSTISKLCDLSFKRIQFTPDLLPSDLIGTMIYSQKNEEFSTKFGPIFTQLLLADEINRAPAKVQAALLEAMAEKQVTIGDETHRLSSPFVVLATQNPIEQEGTYQLPEAQLDRFMMKINVDYPSFKAEKNILDLKKSALNKLEAVLSTDDLITAQEIVENIYVDDKIKDLIVKIVHATRPGSEFFPKEYNGVIISGASPRAVIWLYKVSKFMAFMDGKDFVTPDHILKIVPSILGHRLILSYEASIDNFKGADVALKIAKSLV
ncbi:AAA family ATPase [Bacteriovorax stolpii]|uniref:ATPase n=1 Tax=Bacteriovorax stolpii TaxID=960 RepID=A0A2K9NM91_BACTC|nr:AAA family ATPase [Bacteriovorax stolpii]AUN96628.1 ATPase [Bacteriovorax stolpii]QDK43440.1 AAA family ATPase [Bacteriovorax stolpii]TDP53851.1 MoxR-like ATPase [Bacteriovorax stolpii]